MLYNVVSLFSGCGGLDLGFEKVDVRLSSKEKGNIFKVIFASDFSKSAVDTYLNNFKGKRFTEEDNKNDDKKKNLKELLKNNTIVYQGDIKKIRFLDYLKPEQVDLILAGFPCQDFSMLRGKEKRKGIKVKRGQLYLQLVRALVELQPKIFVAENVKGIKSANDGLAFKQIKNDFQNLAKNWEGIKKELKIDYDIPKGFKNYKLVFAQVVNFAKYGVPQNRERMIMIGIREDLFFKDNKNLNLNEIKNKINRALILNKNEYYPVVPIEIFEGKLLSDLSIKYKNIIESFDSTISKIESEKATIYKEKIRQSYTLDIIKDYLVLNDCFCNEISQKMNKYHEEILKEIGAFENSLYTTNKKCKGYKRFEDNSNRPANQKDNTKKRLKRIPPGQNHEFVKETKFNVKALMSNIYRRLHPLKPSVTVIASAGAGQGYHYEQNKYQLTNRERARLQSFPDNFLFRGKKSEICKQVGNAVPPLASKKIAKVVLSILEEF